MEDRVDNRDLPVIGEPARQSPGPVRVPGLENMPPGARREFPWLETASGQDLRVIARQLGRSPRGKTFVACRCELGRPAVLLTLPDGSEVGPVPPLLWLCCPYRVREVSRMESRGMIRKYGEALKHKDADDREKRLFYDGEERFGRVQALLSQDGIGAPAQKLESRGVAGGRPGALKCLHAHLAYRLASGRGVVGGWCLHELDKSGGLICEKIPEACLT